MQNCCIRHRRPRGFTLIEVLVVVAIIALLIAILLPSLSRAREQSRRAVCASQLKEQGSAIQMYTMEHKDSLPGPVHAALELETYDLNASGEYEEWHLPSFLRKYFSERGRKGKMTDTIASCPTAGALSSSKLANTFGSDSKYRTFSYTLNNWKKDYSGSGAVPWGTNPPWYFGFPDYYWQNAPPPFKPIAQPASGLALDNYKNALPKKLAAIHQPGREWAIADAFTYRAANGAPADLPPRPGRANGQWQRGTYQLLDWANSVSLPRKPYHSDGINQLCFDGHVEYQREWRGTVNAK